MVRLGCWNCMAKKAGHRAETLTSLALASHFKRTHHFILQSFEAINRLFLKEYLKTLDEANTQEIQEVRSTVDALVNELAGIKKESDFVNTCKLHLTPLYIILPLVLKNLQKV